MGRKSEPDCRHVDVMCTYCAEVLSSPQTERLQATIRSLRHLGRLDSDLDKARVAVALGLARAVDYWPDNAALWKQYRDALKDLNADDRSSDNSDDLFPEVRDASET